MCTIHYKNWRGFLNQLLKGKKGLKLMKINFIIDLSTFGSNVLLTLKIMNFENVTLTKVVHIYVIRDMNA